MKGMLPMDRVIAYIDGYNLYHGLRAKGWKRFYWLNIQAMIKDLLTKNQTLSFTKYFTTRVARPADKHKRQAGFLEALQTLQNFAIYYGHFLSDPVTCRNCGHTYETHHEKMTDVNIAVEMMSDAFQNRFDTAFLVTADSDLLNLVRTVRRLFSQKRIIIVFPPKRASIDLSRAGTGVIHIDRTLLAKSQFPDEIVKPDGFVLRRPSRWR
jgi:uncharacterized LabA/DUF88 family protein